MQSFRARLGAGVFYKTYLPLWFAVCKAILKHINARICQKPVHLVIGSEPSEILPKLVSTDYAGDMVTSLHLCMLNLPPNWTGAVVTRLRGSWERCMESDASLSRFHGVEISWFRDAAASGTCLAPIWFSKPFRLVEGVADARC